ncbi:hypothetical protein CHARACLAT_009450 [Characodon lateralis]|uniref:Uncharacterized protein n=1 Tax=Characodon lateralis TaxID=208331 RepID=A0ABU7E915_9TELE|nr:hypothetical protein [Characodon lateralis]
MQIQNTWFWWLRRSVVEQTHRMRRPVSLAQLSRVRFPPPCRLLHIFPFFVYFLQLNSVCKTPWLPALSCTYPECLILPPAAFSGSSFTLKSAAMDQAAGPPLLLRAAVKAAAVSHKSHHVTFRTEGPPCY